MITLYAFLFVNVTKYQLSEETFEISILTNLLRTQYIYIYIYIYILNIYIYILNIYTMPFIQHRCFLAHIEKFFKSILF